jgi:3'-phosphoadenosine 5'-phosphosulfate sulfotransferase (PAPS reductase)/FAD synthetase
MKKRQRSVGMSLFEINEENELVISCKGPVGETHFEFSVPAGYSTSERMPVRSCQEWKAEVQSAAARGEMTTELAGKIIHSLDRLPALAEGQKACISFSNGKDSEATFILAAMRYEREQLMAIFADTKDEWPETYEFQPVFESWIGVPITTVESGGDSPAAA